MRQRKAVDHLRRTVRKHVLVDGAFVGHHHIVHIVVALARPKVFERERSVHHMVIVLVGDARHFGHHARTFGRGSVLIAVVQHEDGIAKIALTRLGDTAVLETYRQHTSALLVSQRDRTVHVVRIQRA